MIIVHKSDVHYRVILLVKSKEIAFIVNTTKHMGPRHEKMKWHKYDTTFSVQCQQ